MFASQYLFTRIFDRHRHMLSKKSCKYCQRETGASYALNSVIELEHIEFTGQSQPTIIQIPSKSGRGQHWVRCPHCQIGVFSIYGGRDKPFWVLRAGTLDNPDIVKPIAHIYTSTKQPWVNLSADIPAFEESYNPTTLWPEETLHRFQNCTGVWPTSW
jgi:hypothetical protein